MRLLLAVLVCCCTLIASPASGDQSFPYTAHITADDVYVRSGPGQSYYPTDKLKAGHEVEVYRHDPGGWYAIRPPEGSFTWVSGRQLQWDTPRPKVPGIARVKGDRVAARVGSRFSDIRDVIQVRLNDQELVEVLEQKRTTGGRSDSAWYKIAPPSGEFRWVFGKYVDPDYPVDGLRKAPAADSPIMRQLQRQSDQAPAAAEPVTVEQPDDRVRIPADAMEPVVPRTVSPDEFKAEVEDIDIELSIMVIEEPTVWEFAEMQARTESLLSQAETALERGRARVLIGKIARFEDIKQRYNRISLMRQQTERTNRQLAGLYPRERNRGGEPGLDDRYDGVGQLIRVVSFRLGGPRYALVDELGEVRCYVSPAPGMNLRHYLGRRVGLNGTRGYLADRRAQHVVAQHVNVLESRLR